MASRNRPRSSFTKDDMTDEQQLWQSIVEKIRRCDSARQQYDSNATKKAALEQEMKDFKGSPKETLEKVEEIGRLNRECLKLAEEENQVLNEEPDDLIRNLETLISVRSAFEIDTPRINTNAPKGRNVKRTKGEADGTDSPAPPSEVSTPVSNPHRTGGTKGASRSGSVAAPKPEAVAEPVEGVKGTPQPKLIHHGKQTDQEEAVVYEKQNKLAVGSEVLLRHQEKDREDSQQGEGIVCTITKVTGKGDQRRYELQDADPNEKNKNPPYKASAQWLVLIPPAGAPLPSLTKGKQVLGRYPSTDTFYKARLVGVDKEQYRLRFEGDNGQEQEVDRRYVLEVK